MASQVNERVCETQWERDARIWSGDKVISTRCLSPGTQKALFSRLPWA